MPIPKPKCTTNGKKLTKLLVGHTADARGKRERILSKHKVNPRINTRNVDTRPRTLYKMFLKSKYWKEVKKKVLERDGHKCRALGCTNKTRLQVHHLNYHHHGFELDYLNDLVTLCVRHHRDAHGLK